MKTEEIIISEEDYFKSKYSTIEWEKSVEITRWDMILKRKNIKLIIEKNERIV